jgi:gas vesicle protein
MLQFLVGLLLGGVVGVLVMAILSAAAQADLLDEFFREMDKLEGTKHERRY